MTQDEFVITGMGVVTPIGACIESFWAANINGTSGLRFEDRMDVSGLPCGWVGGIIDESIKESVRARYGEPGRSWSDTMLHCAVDQALTDARFDGGLGRPAGLVYARVFPGPSGSHPADYVTHMETLADRVQRSGGDPSLMLHFLRNEPLPPEATDLSSYPAEISARLKAPVLLSRIEATCAGGLRGIAEACRMLRMGKIDFAVVSASVSRSTPYVLSQYGQLNALSKWKGEPEMASTPFDKRRSGMVINESAGALIIETAEHARRRGVEDAYAVIGGWGVAVDTTHVTAPQVGSIERVMCMALERARLKPVDIDSVNAHGTSTKLNDLSEARALHNVFGPSMDDIDVCAVKSLMGHGSAASGVVESALAGLTLSRGIVPPVVTCTEPDPACNVKTSLTPVVRQVSTVLKNSFGFGGQYASMVFQRPANPRPAPAAVA